jgi:hypothetical protein
MVLAEIRALLNTLSKTEDEVGGIIEVSKFKS